MLIFSVVMAAVMGGTLALTFVVIIPVLAFGLSDPENIYRAVMGEELGTVVTE